MPKAGYRRFPKARRASFQLAYGMEQVDFDLSRPEFGQKTLYHTTVTEWTDANWDFQIDGGEFQRAQRTYISKTTAGRTWSRKSKREAVPALRRWSTTRLFTSRRAGTTGV